MIETLPLRRIFVPHFFVAVPRNAGSTALLHRGESTALRCDAQYEQTVEVAPGDDYRTWRDLICNQQYLAGRCPRTNHVADGATPCAITAAPNARPPAARRRAPGNDVHRASTWPGYVEAGCR